VKLASRFAFGQLLPWLAELKSVDIVALFAVPPPLTRQILVEFAAVVFVNLAVLVLLVDAENGLPATEIECAFDGFLWYSGWVDRETFAAGQPEL
jgi:hypothetical protein